MRFRSNKYLLLPARVISRLRRERAAAEIQGVMPTTNTRMRSEVVLTIISLSFAIAAREEVAQLLTAKAVGCYVASPAMTYSATGEREQGDSAWAVVRLDSGGVASRPRLAARNDNRSKWTLRHDTLEVLLFDGLVGWRSTLIATTAGWAGTAQYLTDAIDLSRPPYRWPETLTRRKCGPAA